MKRGTWRSLWLGLGLVLGGLAVAQGMVHFQVAVRSPSGQTVNATLYDGNASYGYQHIRVRHITGTKINSGGITSFFPVGYEVRPGVSTPALMQEDEVVSLIRTAVVKGAKQSQGGRFAVNYNPGTHGITNMLVVVDSDDGTIITAYPTAGPSVCTYSDKEHRVIGGDCR